MGALSHLLNRAATHQRNRPNPDGGHFVEDFVTLGSLRMRVAPAGSRELLLAQQLQARVTHAGYAEPAADLRLGDRVLIDGTTYRVTGRLPPSIPGHHLKVLLEEIQHGAAN